jgi:hypothetical protein
MSIVICIGLTIIALQAACFIAALMLVAKVVRALPQLAGYASPDVSVERLEMLSNGRRTGHFVTRGSSDYNKILEHKSLCLLRKDGTVEGVSE